MEMGVFCPFSSFFNLGSWEPFLSVAEVSSEKILYMAGFMTFTHRTCHFQMNFRFHSPSV